MPLPVRRPALEVRSSSKALARELSQPVARTRPLVERSDYFSSDWVQLVELEDGKRWVFRPDEHLRNDLVADQFALPTGTRSSRERALYLLSRHCRLGVVPKTVRGALDGKEGTLQRYVDTRSRPERISDREALETRQAALVTQYLAGIQDAFNPDNRLFGEGRWHVIDGETGFSDFLDAPSAERARKHLAEKANALVQKGEGTLSPRILERLKSVDEAMLAKDLREAGLSESEVGLTLERLHRVQARGLDALRDLGASTGSA